MRISELNSALSRPRLKAGLSNFSLGLTWGGGGIVILLVGTSVGWHWALLPLSLTILIHLILRWAFRKDHHIFDIYMRYSQLNAEYHPYVREKLAHPFERPQKVGRGLRL